MRVRSGTRAIGSTLSSPTSTTLSIDGFAGACLVDLRADLADDGVGRVRVAVVGVPRVVRRGERRPTLSTARIVPPTCCASACTLAMTGSARGAEGLVQAVLRNDEQHVRVGSERVTVASGPASLFGRVGAAHCSGVLPISIMRSEYGFGLFAPL